MTCSCNSLKITNRVSEAQGAAIFNRRLFSVGGFKPPFLGYPRHHRSKNSARVFKILGMTRVSV